MKRFGVLLTFAFAFSLFAGCDSGGIKEGMSDEPPPPSGQPPGFADMMGKNAKNMQLKGGRPKNTPPAAK
jgi:hypothetical protein